MQLTLASMAFWIGLMSALRCKDTDNRTHQLYTGHLRRFQLKSVCKDDSSMLGPARHTVFRIGRLHTRALYIR